MFDGFEGEEQIVPAAEAWLDGVFFVGEMGADGGEGSGVVFENKPKCIFVVGSEGGGERGAGIEQTLAEFCGDGLAGDDGYPESADEKYGCKAAKNRGQPWDAERAAGGSCDGKKEGAKGEGLEREIATTQVFVELIADFEVADALACGATKALDKAFSGVGQGGIDFVGTAHVHGHRVLHPLAEVVPVAATELDDFQAIFFCDGLDGGLQAFDEDGFDLRAGEFAEKQPKERGNNGKALLEELGTPNCFGLEDLCDAGEMVGQANDEAFADVVDFPLDGIEKTSLGGESL